MNNYDEKFRNVMCYSVIFASANETGVLHFFLQCTANHTVFDMYKNDKEKCPARRLCSHVIYNVEYTIWIKNSVDPQKLFDYIFIINYCKLEEIIKTILTIASNRYKICFVSSIIVLQFSDMHMNIYH